MEDTCGNWFPVIVKWKALRDPRGIPPFLRKEGTLIVFIKFHYWNLSGYSDLSVEGKDLCEVNFRCEKWLGERVGQR